MSEGPNGPKCPKCQGEMEKRTARKGKNAGRQFWGCKKYPDCKGTLDIDENGNVIPKAPYGPDYEQYINSITGLDDGKSGWSCFSVSRVN